MFPELAQRIKFCENERLVPSIATQGIRQVELEDLAIWQRLQQELYYEVVWLVWLGPRAISLRFPTMLHDMMSRKFLFLSSNPQDIFRSFAI